MRLEQAHQLLAGRDRLPGQDPPLGLGDDPLDQRLIVADLRLPEFNRRARRQGQPRRKALDLRLALNALSDVVQNRPPPIREFDQIYMKVGDMVVYAEYLCRKLDDRSLVFVGDGDAIGLSIAHLMNEGILDYGPSKLLLLDFDERMVNSVNRFALDNNFADRMEARLYNVADALDPTLLESFDAFHINPPWGQYNDGKSVVSFLRRGAQLLTDQGLGVVAIADDDTKTWPGLVLRMTQKAAIELGMAVVEMQPHMHTYHLEDAPGWHPAR
ncbi:putative methyltransferase [Rhizobium sp. BK538]|nr:putative methyltransferase [Rhizobium sp. BK538]